MAFPKPGLADTASKIKHMYKQLYPWKSKFDCASHLSQNVIYSKDGVVAINKPYGMGLRTITEEQIAQKKEKSPNPTNMLHTLGSGSTYSIEDVLPALKEQLGCPKLVVVKAAEKYNSGVTVFAENEAVAKRIQTSLRSSKPKNMLGLKYYIVSPFTPYEGQRKHYSDHVGITLQKNPVHKSAQPVLLHEFPINAVKRKEVFPARMEFVVLSASVEGPSIIELNVNETRNNLLRIYCADMLMPILGDHLFSTRVGVIQGLATRLNPLHVEAGAHPQKLPEKTWKALGLMRSEDCTLVPLHAHLRSLTLPDFNGRNNHLIISAPCSDVFKWTCSKLNLSIPVET